jgi:preprotein translocase subunit SecA
VQLRDEAQMEKEREAIEKLRAEMEHTIEDISLNHEEQTTIEKKIPRNAPCPCGSGKKYKQCCGQSGPKKGLLARN